jgi:hypothetical protein
VEAVHIQLADKGSIVVVFEQFGDEGSGKFVFIKDNEGVAVVGPSDEIRGFAAFQEAIKC